MYKFFVFIFLAILLPSPPSFSNFVCGGAFQELKQNVNLRQFLLDIEIFTNYSDMTGYIKLADKYFDGDMWMAYNDVFSALGKQKMRKLRWRSFKGTTREFKDLRSLILNNFSTYVDMDGYVRLANKHFDGDMWATFFNVSAVLSKQEFNELKWSLFSGKTELFENLKDFIEDKNKDFFTNFYDMEGYILFADKHFKGNMIQAFKNTFAILGKKRFEQLKWQYFSGSTKDFENLKALIKNKDFFTNFYGMDGYVLFADKHFKGNMKNAFYSVSTILGGRIAVQDSLAWIKFTEHSTKYQQLIRIFKKTSLNNLKGFKGQKMVADKIFRGGVKQAFYSVSSLRSVILNNPKHFNRLNWSIPNSQ